MDYFYYESLISLSLIIGSYIFAYYNNLFETKSVIIDYNVSGFNNIDTTDAKGFSIDKPNIYFGDSTSSGISTSSSSSSRFL